MTTPQTAEISGEMIRGLRSDVQGLAAAYRRSRRFVYVLTTLLCLVVIAGGLAGVAIGQARAAVGCVNHSLGERNKATNLDALAHIVWAQQLGVFLAAAGATAPTDRAQQLRNYEDFVSATKAYIGQLNSDQADRDRHPLGTCA